MFSYSVKVTPINNPKGSLVAFGSLIIDDLMKVEGFRLINGSNGIFMAVPSHKGTKKDDDGNIVDAWYDDVWFNGEEGKTLKEEIANSMISAFQEAKNTRNRTSAASTHKKINSEPKQRTQKPQQENSRTPLW